MRVAFLRTAITLLSREEEHVDRRDGLCELFKQPAIVDLFPAHKELLLDSYMEAVNRQGIDSDSIHSLLDVGIVIAPYFPIDHLSREQLQYLLRQVSKPFSLQGGREHIESQTHEIIQRMTKRGSLYARVEYWRNYELKNREIAEKLGVSIPTVETAVVHLIYEGKLTKRHVEAQDIDPQVKQLWIKGLTVKQIVEETGFGQRVVEGSVRRIHDAGEIEQRGGRSLTPEKVELYARIADLLKQGFTRKKLVNTFVDVNPRDIINAMSYARRHERLARVEQGSDTSTHDSVQSAAGELSETEAHEETSNRFSSERGRHDRSDETGESQMLPPIRTYTRDEYRDEYIERVEDLRFYSRLVPHVGDIMKHLSFFGTVPQRQGEPARFFDEIISSLPGDDYVHARAIRNDRKLLTSPDQIDGYIMAVGFYKKEVRIRINVDVAQRVLVNEILANIFLALKPDPQTLEVPSPRVILRKIIRTYRDRIGKNAAGKPIIEFLKS
jgi:transposase